MKSNNMEKIRKPNINVLKRIGREVEKDYQMGGLSSGLYMNFAIDVTTRYFAEVIATLIQESQKDFIEYAKWLHGYYDFPERKSGDGLYWWRTESKKKLEKLGISLSSKETDNGKGKIE